MFERLYGLPDGFEVAGRLGQAMVAVWAGKSVEPGTFVPYLAAMERDDADAGDEDDDDLVTERNLAIVQGMIELQRKQKGMG